MSDWNKDRIGEIVAANKIVCFAKGTKFQPMCGFSMKAIDILNRLEKPFEVVNIFDDENIRPSLIEFSGWPTTPQVFVNGELLGGSDTVEELLNTGELSAKVEAAFA